MLDSFQIATVWFACWLVYRFGRWVESRCYRQRRADIDAHLADLDSGRITSGDPERDAWYRQNLTELREYGFACLPQRPFRKNA